MTITYTPTGVCSRKMTIEVDEGIIRSVEVLDGCNGNLQGISRLMEGIRCGRKSTSCPDQLAQALKTAL